MVQPSDSKPPPSGAGPDARYRMFIGGLLSMLIAVELCQLYAPQPALRLLVHAAVALFALAGFRLFRLREFYLMGVAAALTAAVFLTEADGGVTVRKAFDQAAFLITFILVLKLLEKGATTSRAILACGHYMTQQPAGRRYAALTVGAHALGVIVNLGTVSLLAPLVLRGVWHGGVRNPEDEIGMARERRQLCALLRGFSWMVIWAPTAVAPAVLLTLIPGIDAPRVFLLGLMIAAIMLVVGWIEDRIRWLPFRRRLIAEGRLPAHVPTPFPARDFLGLLAVCAAFAGLTVACARTGGVGIVPGLMLAAPPVAFGWVLSQNLALGVAGAFSAARHRIGEMAGEALPQSAPIAMTLGMSAYIGVVAAALVPAAALADALGIDRIPAWMFLASLPVALTIVGHLAVSPIMMAVFFGSILGAVPHLPADPSLVALAISCGWALSMTATPFASVVLLTSQATGIPITTLTWKWNWTFALVAGAVLAAIFYLLTGGS
ncbi:MAG: hypothetical protein VX871_08310 [Pseudomonadota bacterium]|nr:hypothetical protein [Pseudomonadota bacterium]